MAIASEVWETARTIWENTPDISYSELVEKLIEIFGEENAPASKSAVATKAKKENFHLFIKDEKHCFARFRFNYGTPSNQLKVLRKWCEI